ncbi:arylsulfatase [Rhodopirellula sp. MGV]|uniref:arylsulfatase n=1 Tax=Rhodopirellula sp. MGV TaxID=2023130 RepID=UPI000B96DABA|nr:arylsulfatase [Rhodopirellula sp. MGV]OYP38409.1 N-acetylgalactosamine 6-sulfate sulfatase [Rhodopirellula sp. MGV]PNY34172.1 N-acetylgalactosamine 6-sulfate sulfatase [Rhodopirellula baltica]
MNRLPASRPAARRFCNSRFSPPVTALTLLLITLTTLPNSANADTPTTRPNVLVILADDQGWGDLSLHGNPNLQTLNIDSLARDGAQFTNFYVCAVCSPTRAEFLTGRYHNRMGVYSTSSGGERFSADEQTIAQRFNNAGYNTAAFGKWHSGMQWPYHPNARGFDEFYGFCSGHWGLYFDPMLEHNGQITHGKGFIIDDLTDHAIDFIDQSDEKPFFVYLPYNTPHSPMQVPDEYWNAFKDQPITPDPTPANAAKQDTPHTRAALAMCKNIDDNVGRLIEHLQSTGKADNTIVVYFSDNGPNGWRFNGGMKGRKGSTNEGGLRSPLVIRFPSQIAAGTKIRTVSGAIDLLPTLSELAGLDWQSIQRDGKPIDGISLAKELAGATRSLSADDRILFGSWKNRSTARTQKYRLHSSGELYDIENDRNEQTDIASKRPDIAVHLSKELQRWETETAKENGSAKSRPFTIAHPDAVWTQLPARDATFSGQIKRSNRFPNCTYLKNWSDVSDKIQWDVEALSSGRYEVQMYYACPKSDVGATIDLTLGDSRLATQIDRPAESPFVGAAHDRVERQEGDVKRWQPITLGTIAVTPGQHTLTLRATEIPGSQVCEMRLLMLRRID